MTAAADVIRAFEGYRPAAYLDTRGRWTVGWGCTGRLRDGRIIGPGVTVTREQADGELEHRLEPLEEVVRSTCPGANEHQVAAMCSFGWNEGTHALLTSKIVALLNAGDLQGAADDFLQWERAGQDAHILHNRRVAERALFLRA
jgi:lysozyme